nr:immunoglobulin heavy chain junction region [Mus musculus]
TGTGTSMSGAQ